MPIKRRFLQLDVFSRQPMKGNPLAVVVDADGLDEATMRDFARWTNLSETAFLLPPTEPGADYRVRIFTPRRELPFAGHPSVGSAYAALESGLVSADKSTLIQQCAAGLLPVRVEGRDASRTIHVQAPPARVERIAPALHETIAYALHETLDEAQVRLVNNGPSWFICRLGDASTVRALQPDLPAIAAACLQHGAIGVAVFGRAQTGDAAMAVRAFCPADNIPEDPVTGSANACIMAFLADSGDETYGPHYRASQGREVGCDGYVDVTRDGRDESIAIGGQCVISIRGEVELG
ncbi:PhzF family phenazine biosynthesis protein [Dyella mobilis]|uniref:PhzF family phenazine biosynthesis protein n=1 Tax=Dyella mobilis TaxID=1849582 RepID=A0ABS2KMP9_9GAMM|nr:PhzF family phenazine biosynthesis protein [Dyella mobilis]MBM7132220.1 PhzF family phenazine biosynthesis protein [Dyella mobilis]GLQ95794.1 phenazine biosynthesis protein [Dyella mobilis]